MGEPIEEEALSLRGMRTAILDDVTVETGIVTDAVLYKADPRSCYVSSSRRSANLPIAEGTPAAYLVRSIATRLGPVAVTVTV